MKFDNTSQFIYTGTTLYLFNIDYFNFEKNIF